METSLSTRLADAVMRRGGTEYRPRVPDAVGREHYYMLVSPDGCPIREGVVLPGEETGEDVDGDPVVMIFVPDREAVPVLRSWVLRMVYLAVVDTAAHGGHVVGPLFERGWTYQEHTAPHGDVLAEGTRQECEAALATFLQCDAPARGTYCYAHNPGA